MRAPGCRQMYGGRFVFHLNMCSEDCGSDSTKLMKSVARVNMNLLLKVGSELHIILLICWAFAFSATM